MQKILQRVESALNSKTLDMLATIGGYNEQMYQKGLEDDAVFRRGHERRFADLVT